MQSALWKIAALFSVIGVGSAVVYKVHDQLQFVQQDVVNDPHKFTPPDGDTGAGDPAEARIALGDERDSAESDPFSTPPPGQVEPGAGDVQPPLAENERTVADDRSQSPFVDRNVLSPETDAVAAANPFETAGGFDSRENTPGRFSRNTATTEDLTAAPVEVELAGNGFGAEADSATAADAPQEPATTDGIRLAAADGFDALPAGENAAANPFGGPGDQQAPGVASDSVSESPSFGSPGEQTELILPGTTDGPGTAATATEPGPAAANSPFDAASLPEAQTATSAPESGANPFDSRPAIGTEPPPAAFGSGAYNPFGGSEPATEAILPNDSGPTEGAAPLMELGAPSVESGVAQQPPANTEPQPIAPGDSVPSFGPSFHDPAAAVVEPQRLPPVEDDDGPPPKTALRGHRAAPLTPPRNEPPVQIIPNPLPAQSDGQSPRPEFVGDATLDGNASRGPQQPELTIQKVAPKNATVGDPLVYAIRVKNVGNSTARDVIVEDRIPRGTTLEGSIPQAEMVEKKLIWQLKDMAPGQEKTIRIKVVPTEAGEIGSVATVRFVAEVAATTKITMPNLTMDVKGPGESVVGEQAVFHFHIVNAGDGEARNVYIRNLLPAGLEHPGGKDIEYDVGVLKPGETREVDLAVKTTQEGSQALKAILHTGSTQRAETETPVNVIKSRLLIQRQGPKRRFVGRPADYNTVVSNRSSAPLKGVSVVERLPAGLELAAAPEGGHFDQQRRTITWQIRELPPGAQVTLKTSVIAQRPDRLESMVQASDTAGNRAQLASHLEVAGFASLSVDLNHNGQPVGVGEQVALQLKVKNRGTGAAEGVEAAFEIPEHLEFVNADGPAEFRQEGRTVRFAALEELPANGEKTYNIVLTAREAGNTAVTAQLMTADGAQPLRHTEQVIVEGDGP